jgi:hypothetical protein
MDVVYSINRAPIRLTDERWEHIVSARDELVGYYDDCLHTIEEPDFILRGRHGSLKAVRSFGRNRFLVVIYKEISRHDGFVITAYFVRRINRGDIVWRR